MINLIINNSYSQIQGLKTEQFRPLRELLSYDSAPDAKYYVKSYSTIKYLIDHKGFFPSGLLSLVTNHLHKSKIEFSTQDLRKRPERLAVEFKPKFQHKPYPDQTNATNAALRSHRGTLSMPTGSGKSNVISMIIAKLNVKTLVVVPNLEIKKQLSEGLKSIFGGTKHIIVENIDSARLKDMTDFDCLIIDESHHVAAGTYQKLNKKCWNNVYYRFFLTATPFRNQQHEQLLFQAIAGEKIFELTYKDAIKRGYIVPVEAYYIELPKQDTDAHTWAQVYSELVVNNQSRNQKILTLLTNLENAGVSTLCLVKEIKHGNLLSEKSNIGFTNGQDEDSRKLIQQFNSRKIKALIATSGVIGEGVDTKPCEYVIIAGLGKAKSAFMQQVGRCVRTYPGKESGKVILIKDRSHKFCLKHFNEQSKILLDEYGIRPVKLDYD